jgi:hypothetical protein
MRSYEQVVKNISIADYIIFDHQYLDATIPLTDQIASLRCLHRVVELWALIKTHTPALPSERLREVIAALKYYLPKTPQEVAGPNEDAFERVKFRSEQPRYSVVVKSMTG